jgi:hypothetical protein
MEIVLNVAWAICSLGLILYWARTSASNPVPRGRQIFALAMVVLLLLPVISLSDDLMAMQGPAETDSCLRRVLQTSDAHPSVVPTSFALPEEIVAALSFSCPLQEIPQDSTPAIPASFLIRALDSRPPPQV